VQLGAIVGLTVNSDLDLGAFSNGIALPLIGIYAGWFLARRAALLMYVGVVAWVAVMLVRSGSVLSSIALTVAVEAILATEVVWMLRRRIFRLTRTDSLTGVLNRRAIESEGRRMVGLAARRGRALSVALIDLDDLRTVNNTRGHLAGDHVLLEATRQWQEELVGGEVVGRIGGDEFVMLLPGASAAAAEERVADLCRRATARWTAGIAELRTGETLEQVLERADQQMYDRKGVQTAAGPDGGQR
jgi:diguanylate cyclase (GGDEF)-like protein